MKRKAYLFGSLLLTALAIQSFTINYAVEDEPLVVERQECVLQKVKHHVTGMPYKRKVTVDVPIKGKKVLVDTVITFLNKSLYEFFEPNNGAHLAYDDVASSDSRHLLAHYKKAYRKWYKSDRFYLNNDFFEVLLVAQTDDYVTYERDWSFWGEGITTNQDWTTFMKSNGHRISEVISEENLLRFLKEHPDQRDNNIWEDIQYKKKEGVTGMENVGLLKDSVVHQHCYAYGIYETTKYDLKVIMPYLSQEALLLVRGNR